MERAARHGLKPPRVFPKRATKAKALTSVAMSVDDVYYYLTPDEAMDLANRLVDTAEAIQAWREGEQ